MPITAEKKLTTGYKQTEIGMIPEDWGVEKIKDLASITTGSRNTQDRINDGLYPFFVRSQTVERINTYSYDGEAILTAGDGVGTGKVFHYINGKFDFHQRVYKISDFKKNLDGYFFYLYFSNNFYNRIMQMTAKSSVDSVRMEMIADMLMPVPSGTEQIAISQSVSDVAQLVANLEKLIEKKKNIKQGAMQELLTGKRRLPGFKPEWKTIELGELFSLSATYSKTKFINDGGNYLIMDMGSVSSIGKLIASKTTYSNTDLLKVGDLVMPKDDIGGGNIIGKVAYIDQNNKYILGDHVYKLTAKVSDISTLFFAYLINSHIVSSELKKKVSGSAQLGLGRKSVEEQDVKFPQDKNEQIAIAGVLSDMDSEIEKLESQLSKYQNIKQGMMQTLLTGKIRLK